ALEKDGPVAMGRAISDGANDAYIQDIFVKPQFRKRGIASALLKKLLAQLKKDKMRWIGLIADHKAVGLYHRHGFRTMHNFSPMRKK
ncbi:MAG TPA: GNAT family N-acetyltransferase, partial [Elusimicrobiales bacterium]|nr:GNAT family N-acetyltransferase [Elusimicrobiales bacterium]